MYTLLLFFALLSSDLPLSNGALAPFPEAAVCQHLESNRLIKFVLEKAARPLHKDKPMTGLPAMLGIVSVPGSVHDTYEIPKLDCVYCSFGEGVTNWISHK